MGVYSLCHFLITLYFILDTLSFGLSSIFYFEQLICNEYLLSFVIVNSYVNWDSVTFGPQCLWFSLIWSSRHGYNFELDIFGTTIPLVDSILELRYDFKLGVVWTTVLVVNAIFELGRYGL